MIPIKTSQEVKKIAASGKIAQAALNEVLKHVKVGITTLELNNVVEEFISKNSAKPGFKSVEGYDFATCININEGIVHGIPGNYKLQSGDLVSIDLGVLLDGWHSDISYTVEVETDKHGKFLEVGKKALEAGVFEFLPGNKIGDVGHAIQKVVESAGYSVSRDLVGHGVGRELHEDPYVPGYGEPGTGIEIKEGMVFAIEVIYQTGQPEIEVLDDDWTVVTADSSLSALFEHTVAATKDGSRILTL